MFFDNFVFLVFDVVTIFLSKSHAQIPQPKQVNNLIKKMEIMAMIVMMVFGDNPFFL